VAFIFGLKKPVGVPVTIEKFIGADEPPPGLGFVTTTGYDPVAATSFGPSAIWICVALCKELL
jgi:hypothetical protein